jgi:dTDP-4-amino-4,6-dideoxygalactose transaminase
MKIPLIDTVAQYRNIQSEINQAIQQVLEGGQYILGPNVAAFEKEVASYLGVEYGVGVASGTDALILALRALEIGPGDEVIVPTYTFFATVEAIMLVGAKPVFVDIQPDTYCLDVSQIAKQITSRTKAIIPVHLYGHPCDMDQLVQLAKSHNLKIVEDNAQSFGSEYKGRKAGSLGDIGCLSFFPSKNLGGFGDGGMVVTNDAKITERVKMLRSHGWKKKYYPEMIGYNSRLDELHAAMLRVKLRYVNEWNDRRREVAGLYTQRLQHLNLGTPYEAPYAKHVYNLYIIQVENRDQVEQRLKADGIGSSIYYPQPVHLTDACKSLGYKNGDFPVSEKAAQITLSIPFYPEMTEEQIEVVSASIANAIKPISELKVGA